MKARKNPYASRLKRPVTIRLGDNVIGYFKDLADELIGGGMSSLGNDEGKVLPLLARNGVFLAGALN